MPDGDKYHSKLSWYYQEPYRDICERKLDYSEIIWSLKNALLRDIKKNYGALSVKYAKRIGEILQRNIENSGKNSSINWNFLSTEIDRHLQQASFNHYVKEILCRASKRILHEFRYKQRVETNNLPEIIVGSLFQEIYKSNFEERIPLTTNHHADIDNAAVESRIAVGLLNKKNN
jgi:hypothetical protein